MPAPKPRRRRKTGAPTPGFRRLMYPAHGTLQDIENIIFRFTQQPTLRFSCFTDIWKDLNFSLIHMGRAQVGEKRDFTSETFKLILKFLFFPYTLQVRVAAIYLIYGIFHTQLCETKSRVYLTLKEWKELTDLHLQLSLAGHQDAEYILHRMRDFDLVFRVTACEEVKCREDLYDENEDDESDVDDVTDDNTTDPFTFIHGNSLLKLLKSDELYQIKQLQISYQNKKEELFKSGPWTSQALDRDLADDVINRSATHSYYPIPTVVMKSQTRDFNELTVSELQVLAEKHRNELLTSSQNQLTSFAVITPSVPAVNGVTSSQDSSLTLAVVTPSNTEVTSSPPPPLVTSSSRTAAYRVTSPVRGNKQQLPALKMVASDVSSFDEDEINEDNDVINEWQPKKRSKKKVTKKRPKKRKPDDVITPSNNEKKRKAVINLPVSTENSQQADDDVITARLRSTRNAKSVARNRIEFSYNDDSNDECDDVIVTLGYRYGGATSIRPKNKSIFDDVKRPVDINDVIVGGVITLGRVGPNPNARPNLAVVMAIEDELLRVRFMKGENFRSQFTMTSSTELVAMCDVIRSKPLKMTKRGYIFSTAQRVLVKLYETLDVEDEFEEEI